MTFLPFTTTVLADYPSTRTAVGVYWVNLLLLGLWLGASDCASSDAGSLVGQALYGTAAFLCLVSTTASIVLERFLLHDDAPAP